MAEAADVRKVDAEIALLQAQTKKVEAELARQSLEDEECEKRIESLEARIAREWLWMLLPALLLAILVVTGPAGNPTGSGMEIFSGEGWWPLAIPMGR